MQRKYLTLTLLTGLAVSGAAHAALHDRGGGLIYDDVLNITWLQDALYAKTGGYDADGEMDWAAAVEWAASLSYYDSVRNVTYTDWRLPMMVDTGAPGCDIGSDFWNSSGTDCGFDVQTYDPGTGQVYSELAHLYYISLGNTKRQFVNGQTLGGFINSGPFINVLDGDVYWFGLEYAPEPSRAWNFTMWWGFQEDNLKDAPWSAWAVRSGDVTVPIPEPETSVLMLAALGLVGYVARCRKRHST